MDSILSVFLLFIAAITALLTYMIVPFVPVVTLVTAAAIALAAGIWWHWTQFSVDYRTSTWQEQLRNYASYALLLVVILLSYGFYVFAWSGSSIQDLASHAQSVVRNAGRKASSQIIGSASRALTATQSAIGNESLSEPAVAPNRNRGANILV
jgi:hypothetical protein